MICFPDLSALQFALAGDAVPTAVSRAPASAGRDAAGRIWLRPSVALSGGVRTALVRCGVHVDGPGEPLLTEEVTCWQQLVPPLPLPAAEALAANVVLFETTDFTQWNRLTAEVRRLRGPAATVAWCEPIDGDGLLLARVTGTPTYPLLRAMETVGDEAGLRAYVAQAEGVWVEAGWRHPLAHQLHAPPGRLILIRRNGAWRFLADGPFVAELREFRLPERPVAPVAAAPELRPEVRLRLLPVAVEPAELWVLRDQPHAQLAALVRDADDTLLSGLTFAVCESEGRPLVVLRARPGKATPPSLVLRAEGYRQHLKLPNLYVPVGARLHPPLRRDAVRQLLAPDPERVTWLAPHGATEFIPEDLPADRFQSLGDHVAYISEREPRRWQGWTQTHRFDFDAYDVREEPPEDVVRKLRPARPAPGPPTASPPPSPPPTEEAPQRSWWGRTLDAVGRWFTAGANRAAAPSAPPPARNGAAARWEAIAPPADGIAEAVQMFLAPSGTAATAAAPAPRAGENGDRQQRLEQRFLALTGPPDAPERRALWPELAGGYQGAGNWVDAAGCWLHALWEEPTPTPMHLYGWFRAETRAAFWQDFAADVQRALAARRPDPADIRAVAAFVVWAAADGRGSAADAPTAAPSAQREFLMQHLRRFREYLEGVEGQLPVRGAWLAWSSLARLSGGDLLTLARARDRLLERLFRRGLSVELDLPSFLRFAAHGGGEHFQTVRDWLRQLRQPVHRWIDRLDVQAKKNRRPPPVDPNVLTTEKYLRGTPLPSEEDALFGTRGYADLLLAWGSARLGGAADANQLVRKARELFSTRDAVHRWLFAAFEHRIVQTLEEGVVDGPLPAALLADLEALDPLLRNKIDWLRQQSRVLEPVETVDPFHGEVQRDRCDGLQPRLARLAEVRDRDRLAAEAQALLAEAAAAPPAQAALPRALKAALELSPRVGEAFARDLLDRTAAVLDRLTDPAAEAALLERALFVAAHFEQGEQVEALVARFEQLLERQRGATDGLALDALAAQSFRGLHKLGLHDPIDRLLRQTADCLLPGGGSIADRVRGRPPAVLRTLLHVAAGWFYEGLDADATAILDEVRRVLFTGELEPREQVALAAAYAAALGRAPGSIALERVEELFRKLDRIHDRLNTNTHFSLAQLGVVEAVVRAVVHDDFALGAAVRRWLDGDEYLVRRRIHRDLRALMG